MDNIWTVDSTCNTKTDEYLKLSDFILTNGSRRNIQEIITSKNWFENRITGLVDIPAPIQSPRFRGIPINESKMIDEDTILLNYSTNPLIQDFTIICIREISRKNLNYCR